MKGSYINSVELFAGAGGLALGSSNSGIKHLAVIEWDKYACDTIRENQIRNHHLVQNWPLFEMDVRKFNYSYIKNNVTLVTGGPPCQPFSLGGKHKANEDSRDMFPEAIRAICDLKPKSFIFENVNGLIRRSFESYFNYIYLRLTYPEIAISPHEKWERHLARLEKQHTSGRYNGLYYRVVCRVLNAADYGVPQKRKRVFFVGFRSDIGEEWSFPEPTHSEDSLIYDQWVSGEYWDRHKVSVKQRPQYPKLMKTRIEKIKSIGPQESMAWQTVRDSITDLPKPSVYGSNNVLNHIRMPGARVYVGHTGSPIDQPAKALKAGVHGVPGGENMLAYSNGAVRYFTIREAARLQTFPDDYLFHGSWTACMRQLGNAVPMKLASVVAKSVISKLQKKKSSRKG